MLYSVRSENPVQVVPAGNVVRTVTSLVYQGPVGRFPLVFSYSYMAPVPLTSTGHRFQAQAIH